jgi:type IV secretory pathway TrbD component
MAAFTFSWRIFVEHQEQDWSGHPARILIFRILIWPVMGYLMGLLLWHINEARFRSNAQLPTSIAKQ